MATTTDAPESVTLSLEQLSVLLKQAVDAAVAPLQERIERIDRGQSRIIRKAPENPSARRNRTYEPPEELRKKMRGNVGYSGSDTQRWLDTPRGRAALPEEYQPVFRPGDLVQVNGEKSPRGDSRAWSEILAQHATNKEGIGEILGTMYMGKSWEPKYKVAIPGFSGGTAGLWESDLLPYE